jgi:hypothetical protein
MFHELLDTAYKAQSLGLLLWHSHYSNLSTQLKKLAQSTQATETEDEGSSSVFCNASMSGKNQRQTKEGVELYLNKFQETSRWSCQTHTGW